MKKRFLSIALIALLLTGCGGKNLPSDTAISCAEQAINVTKDYLDGKSTYESTYEVLNELSDTMSYVTEPSDEKNNPNHSEDLYVQISISSIKMHLLDNNLHTNDESQKKIEDDILELEDLIKK